MWLSCSSVFSKFYGGYFAILCSVVNSATILCQHLYGLKLCVKPFNINTTKPFKPELRHTSTVVKEVNEDKIDSRKLENWIIFPCLRKIKYFLA